MALWISWLFLLGLENETDMAEEEVFYLSESSCVSCAHNTETDSTC